MASDLPSLGGRLALTFLSLGLVCLLAYFLLKWVSRRGLGHSGALIRVIARCSPEPRRSFFLLEAAGRCFLVGASDGGMTLLAEVDPKDVKAEEPASSRIARATSGARSAFGDILARILARPAAPGSVVDAPETTSGHTEPEHDGPTMPAPTHPGGPRS
jgi:flagellar biogenesis protein FliO